MFAPTSYWNRFLNWLETTRLWWPIDYVLSCIVVVLFCLKYLVDDWRFQVRMDKLRQSPNQWAYTVPLATVPQTLETLGHNTALTKLIALLKEKMTKKNDKDEDDNQTDDDDDKHTEEHERISFSDAHIVDTLHDSLEARLLVSQAMVGRGQQTKSVSNNSNNNQQLVLVQQLERLWPQLLEETVSASSKDKEASYDYEISLIVPAYRENPISLLILLTTAWKHTADPQKVQVLVVNAGGCGDLHDTFADGVHKNKWGQFQVLDYRGGGGRGGCMNFGAQQHAKGRVLTFLHADTLLPDQWDAAVRGAIRPDNAVHLAAFQFGIDMSKRGLRGDACPPALKWAAWQGRIRSHVCQMPYGDSALSVRASVFTQLGGYPHHQPLMEDYTLVMLLKQRAALFQETTTGERLALLPLTTHCSPRRWQVLSVAYVALANWTFVSHYKKGMPAEELYELYYGRPVQDVVVVQAQDSVVPQATESSDGTVDSSNAVEEEEKEDNVGDNVPQQQQPQPQPAVRSTEEVKDGSRLYRATAADIMEAYRASKTNVSAEEKKKDD